MTTAPRIWDMAREIVVREGGLADDPNDRGGITKYGVSLRYARGKGLIMDLDGDGDVDRDDILLVTPEKATELFVEDFCVAPGIDKLPEALQPVVFDMAVLHGPGGAIKVLQQALTKLGFPLTADGGCGPRTQAAARKAADKLGKMLVNAVVRRRIERAYEIADADPTQRKYVVNKAGGKGGWITRAESFMV